jgi:hypothetical protein
MNATVRRAALAAAVVAVFPVAAFAQGDLPVGRLRFLTGFEMRSVSFDSGLGVKTISEIAIPLGAMYNPSTRLALDFGIRYASASRTPSDAAVAKGTVSGPTDLQVRGVFQVIPDAVVLTVAANLPTGKTKMSGDELVAAGAVASELIPFPVTSFGTGANVTTGLAVAVPVAGWALGLAGAYRLSGAYTLQDTVDTSYKPGSELRFRIGADRVVGQGRVSLGFTYSSFSQDEFGGASIYQPGKRYISQASVSFPVGNLGLALYAWDLYRTSGTALLSSSATGKQNVLAAGLAVSVQMGRSTLRPQIEFRKHMVGVDKLEAAGQLLSLSTRLSVPLSEAFTLTPAVRFDTGNVVSGATYGFTGWGLSVGIRANL